MKSRRRITVSNVLSLSKRLLVLVAVISIVTPRAYAAQTEEKSTPRTLERLDVGHELPIEIVGARNLQQVKYWVRDLELEVKNVSTKPIYEMYFTLFLPDDKGSKGFPYGTYLSYGRFQLINPGERSRPDDIPLLPGETVVLRVHEVQSRGYEHHLEVDKPPNSASHNVRLIVVAINFGDGTGFVNGGIPYPGEQATQLRPHRYVRIPVNPE